MRLGQSYNAQNRPTRFTRENADGTRTVITAAYDYMGRRAWKKVETIATDPATGEETATVTLHQRYIYRGYLQIAACDLTRGSHPCLWLITWDPMQPTATRPLAIQKDGTWYCYGWDLTKNICEVFGQAGYIRTTYSYTPYGSVTEEGDIAQPLQWSSEYADPELGLVYYNYRSYNPRNGRWTRRDDWGGYNLYSFVQNRLYQFYDFLGFLGWSKTYTAMDDDLFWDDEVGTITLQLKVNENTPLTSFITVVKQKGAIQFKPESPIERNSNSNNYVLIELKGVVEATMTNYTTSLEGMYQGATQGAAIGGAVGSGIGGIAGGIGGATAGGVGVVPGAIGGAKTGGLLGGALGGFIGGIAGIVDSEVVTVSVSIDLLVQFKCDKQKKKWKLWGVTDNSQSGGAGKGDLYIK